MKDFKRDASGSITIFLTLILVPCVVFISLFIDLARFEYISYKLQASSDLALNAGLTNYNSDLKQMYGLFGVSEVEETEKLISEYFLSNLNVNYGLEASDNFDFYQIKLSEADSQSIGSVVNNTNLRNTNVLKQQIVEYMKYLGPYEIGTEIFDLIDRIKKSDNDNKALKQKNEIDEHLAKVDEKYQELANLVAKNSSFEGYKKYLDIMIDFEILNESYKERDKLLDEIDSLEKQIKEIQKKESQIVSSTNQDNKQESSLKDSEEKPSEEKNKEEALIEKLNKDLDDANHNLQSIEKTIEYTVNRLKPTYKECKELFENQDGIEKKIKSIANDIETELRNAEKAKNKLETDFLDSTSSSVKKALNKQIEDEYNKILGTTESSNLKKLMDFAEENIRSLEGDTFYIKELKKTITDEFNKNGPLSEEKIEEIFMYDFGSHYIFYEKHEETKDFIEFLKNYQVSGDKVRNELDDAKNKLEQFVQDKLNGKLDIDDVEIPDVIFEQLSGKNSEEDEELSSDSIQRDELSSTNVKLTFVDADFGNLVENLRDKLLTIQYAKGMFTNYRSNRDKDNQINSYTNIPMNKMNNYLYQGELEYLIKGQQSVEKNIKSTEAKIKNFRFALNYIYTFTDNQINTQLNTLSSIAVGSFGPLAVTILRESLRFVIADLESRIDANDLLNGENVPLIKTSTTWNLKLENIFADKLKKIDASNNDDNNVFNLYYEDYMNLFLLMSNEKELLNRIGDLIELNMPSNKNNGVLGESLRYQLKNTYAYFQIHSELEADFVFMRLPFVNLFLDEGIKFEKRSMKYKDIKGY